MARCWQVQGFSGTIAVNYINMAKQDKQLEYNRYNERSRRQLENADAALALHGAESVSEALRSPYLYYEQQVRSYIKPGTKVLDLCCGNGIFSILQARLGADLTCSDIAENSLKVAAERMKREGLTSVRFVAADAEDLPFADGEFEVVTCVGSISYVELEVFIAEVKRVLRKDGVFLCLDSLNHNWIYRINRYIHYLKGERSYSTLKRMPNQSTIKYIRSQFAETEVSYFGIFSFLSPILTRIVSNNRAADILDNLDKRFSFFKRESFKFVCKASKKVNC